MSTKLLAGSISLFNNGHAVTAKKRRIHAHKHVHTEAFTFSTMSCRIFSDGVLNSEAVC